MIEGLKEILITRISTNLLDFSSGFELTQNGFWDLIYMLPEIYMLIMILVGLVLIGLANSYSRNLYKNCIIEEEQMMTLSKIKKTSYCYLQTTLSWSLGLNVLEFLLINGDSMTIFSDYSITDIYTIGSKILVLGTTKVLLHASKDIYLANAKFVLEYPILYMLKILFLMVLISSYNFVTLLLGMVGFSLSLYVLLLANGFNAGSREAGVKYFYLSTISTGLLLFGTFLIYLIFQTTNFMAINWLAARWKEMDTSYSNWLLMSIMLFFIIVGFLYKLAAFPCHFWSPEVYEGSPSGVTAILVIPIKIATFSVFARILGHTFSAFYDYWYYIIWLSAAFSMIWGCLGALSEKKIKRFIAYSSINQIGIMLMGLACGTFEGFRAAMLYLVLYAIMNLGLFLVYLTTKESIVCLGSNNSIEEVQAGRPYLRYLMDFSDLNGYIINQRASRGLALILFSMAGIPPLGGFFGKYFIFYESFVTGNLSLVVIGMVTSVIAAYYYLRIIKIMLFDKLTEPYQILGRLEDYKIVMFRYITDLSAVIISYTLSLLFLVTFIGHLSWVLDICIEYSTASGISPIN